MTGGNNGGGKLDRHRFDAIIVGAGHNGLVTAGYLSRAGLRVLVLEARELVGGACVTEEAFPGYKVSTAAYLCSLLQPKIIADLELAYHGYEVRPKDPASFTPFLDGRYLIFWKDKKKTLESISNFSSADAQAYPKYEAQLSRLADFVEGTLLMTPPNLLPRGVDDLLKFARLGVRTMRLGATDLAALIKIMTCSAADYLDFWFDSEELKVTLATDGVIGARAGPRSPGTAYVLLHHCMGGVGGQRGLWGFVKGGMGSISNALASSAQKHGATIMTSAPVKEILIENGRSIGVVTMNGDDYRAPIIVSGVDPKRTFLKLLNKDHLDQDFRTGIEKIRMEGVSFKLNLAVSELPDFTALPGRPQSHHRATIHLCPNIDYLERAWDDAKYGRPSQNPMVEITIPTMYEPELAPAGCHILSIFSQYAPYTLESGSWKEERETFADRILDVISEYAPNIKKSVIDRHMYSPLDLEEKMGMTGGSIFHGDMTPDQLFFLRPIAGWARYKTPIRGLFLCGSGTHPGGGVMGAPGHNAAQAILETRR